MIVEMTYDNGKHIATYQLGSVHNIKKVKEFLQDLFDKENPERFYCDFKGCGHNYSSQESLDLHMKWHEKEQKPIPEIKLDGKKLGTELLQIEKDESHYQCILTNGKIGCSHNTNDICTHSCHRSNK